MYYQYPPMNLLYIYQVSQSISKPAISLPSLANSSDSNAPKCVVGFLASQHPQRSDPWVDFRAHKFGAFSASFAGAQHTRAPITVFRR
jgi:hypothetical protein